LRRYLKIVQTDLSAWRALAGFHYRQHWAGAVDKVFAIVHDQPGKHKYIHRKDEPVGVIVYAMPVPSVALRNLATGNRYTGIGRDASLRLINDEIRCISRVVIHPQYRGIGLGCWLVGQTLEKAGTVFVEAMAVMGRVNPFFDKAGMTRYEAPLSGSAVRMIGALNHVGIKQEQIIDRTLLLKAIDKLSTDDQKLIAAEMRLFAKKFSCTYRHLNSKTWSPADGVEALTPYVQIVVDHLLSNPIYYLWQRNC